MEHTEPDIAPTTTGVFGSTGVLWIIVGPARCPKRERQPKADGPAILEHDLLTSAHAESSASHNRAISMFDDSGGRIRGQAGLADERRSPTSRKPLTLRSAAPQATIYVVSRTVSMVGALPYHRRILT
jgi:hypothetical protein